MDKPTDNIPTSRHPRGAGKSSFSPARLHPFSLLRKAGTALCEPVVGSLRLLIWLTLMLACAPLAQMLFSGASLLRLALAALLQGFAWSYLLCALILIIPDGKWRRCFSRFLGFVAALGALPDLGCTALTGTPFTADSVSLILETSPAEAGGFFTQYLTAGGLLKILLYYTLCGACALGLPPLARYIRQTAARKWPGLRSIYSRYLMPFCGFILLAAAFAGGWSGARLLRGAFIHHYTSYLVWQGEMPSDNPMLSRFNRLKFGDISSKWANIANEISLRDAEIKTWEASQKEVLAMFNRGGYLISCTPVGYSPKFNIAVIIGESFIRSHSSLYGYPMPVNPRLRAEADSGRLVVFTDMVTTANFTTPSLRNLLNAAPDTASFGWPEGVYLPLLLKKYGYSVGYFDNQTAPSSNADFGLSRMIYSPEILSHAYDVVSDTTMRLDGPFVDYVHRYLLSEIGDAPVAAFYHIWGQHFPASDRYPHPGKFSASDIPDGLPVFAENHRDEIADYANATLYNDSIVGAIIDRWRSSPTLLIYLSDHGEDCWDVAPMEARNISRPDDPAWIERQFAVPFMVWLSDPLRKSNPALEQRLLTASTRPGTLADFGHFILGLTCRLSDTVDCPQNTVDGRVPFKNVYNPRRDISSDSYIPRPRVSVGGNTTNPPPAKLPTGD